MHTYNILNSREIICDCYYILECSRKGNSVIYLNIIKHFSFGNGNTIVANFIVYEFSGFNTSLTKVSNDHYLELYPCIFSFTAIYLKSLLIFSSIKYTISC